MKNTLVNKIIFTVFLSFAALNCNSNASNIAVNVNTSNPVSNEVLNANVNNADAAVAVAVAEVAPDVLVADLYKQHDADKSPFFQTKSRALVDKYFTKATADLIWNDLKNTPEGEIGALGADPLYNAQDSDIKNFKVGKASINGGKATVPVTFQNFGEKNTVVFELGQEKANWKISDIKYDSDYTLVGLYKENAPEKSSKESENSSSGEFEGNYKVGDTTCIVKPTKMAFEVKWAKGTGTEMFFSQDRANDKYIFASEPPKGGANVFSFDDENYNSGTFYREDGKQFTIKRIK